MNETTSTKGYYSTKDLQKHYRRSPRTLYRWVTQKRLPPPVIRQQGAPALWRIEDIEAHDKSIAEQAR